MADLIAQGRLPENRWRRTLVEGQWFTLGRGAGTWAVPWDSHISRRHAEMRWMNRRLEVRRLDTSRNPIFVRGQASTTFHLKPGGHFIIGDTSFMLADEQPDVQVEHPQPAQEQTFSADFLRQLRYRNADQRIDVLSRLPDVIAGAGSEDELFVQLVNMLLVGIPRSQSVALVAIDDGPAEGDAVELLHWDSRGSEGSRFATSERLIRAALERHQSVLHVWESQAGVQTATEEPFTMAENADWAFCTPVLGDETAKWAIYVTGRFSTSSGDSRPSDLADLRDDVKFTELIAALLRSLWQMRRLQKRYAGLSQFFAPAVLGAVASADPDEVLSPRETEVCILFCDLRGFSRQSEKYASNLLGLLARVSSALGVMTHHILEQGGVVGDFQGDAAMGFWGWPIAQPDMIARACRAALGIREAFAAAALRPDDPLADFRMGIGVATGRAVAGRIGTIDQVKVSVFGPVVNLASRLEGLTKIFRAPILLDEVTASAVAYQLGSEHARTRRVARVRPYGLETPLAITELLPPASDPDAPSDEGIATYEKALADFDAGRWSEAFDLLHRVPPNDRVKDYLTVYIAQYNRAPPSNWDGSIHMTAKGA